MKIYLSASLSRYRKLLPVTQDIARIIEELGHNIVSKHVVDPKTTADPKWEESYNPKQLFNREMKRLISSDALVAEVTTPSYGGGFLVEKCVQMKKPLICLHYGLDKKNATLMLQGHPDINLQMYTEDTIRDVLKKFFATVKKTD